MAEKLRTIRSLGPWMLPLIAAGLLLLIGTVAFLEWQTLDGLRLVDESTEVHREQLHDLADTRALAKAVVDMETALRGFLLTGEEAFLSPFVEGRTDFSVVTLALRERWRGEPQKTAILEKMVAIESEWRNQHALPLIHARRQAADAGRRYTESPAVARGEGKRRIDAFRLLADNLEARITASVRDLSLDIDQKTRHARDLAMRTSMALLLSIGFMAAVIARGFRVAAERNAQLSREISDRERAEIAARASQAQFAAFLNGLSEALVITDDHGRVIWCNPRLPALFGRAPEELPGAAVTMLFAHPERQPLESHYLSLRSGTVEITSAEAAARHTDGREFPVEVAMSRFEAPDAARIAMVIRDISERKAVERLKSEFIASVSHELRTPLTAIMGALALLREGEVGELPEGTREFVDMAHANSVRLARLVDDVIDVERIGSGALAFDDELFDLPALLEESVQLNRGYADAHGVAIALQPPVPAVRLRGDRSRLLQAITNLLSNACKFSPKGEQVCLAATRTAETLRLTVTDRGPGIPEEFRPRVFEKFAQADGSDSRKRGGTGLGLAIARAIVVRLGGAIGFETQTGRGTTFWIELPIAGEAPSA